ncbi:hypothetical protein [uncultured Methanoregula sp.]|uniref:hypothetical protein n=1 Tax=uncultured Methanoregula sp. TaxID=1005933 RepID=UPI002AAC28AF|nr:hypothetical protein [uncultured Methanoregula sp.]
MIFGLYKNVIGLIKSVTKSVKTKIISLVRPVNATTPKKSPAGKYTIASEIRCARIKGQWGRLPKGHAPIFSLFTYFPDRQ